MSEYQLKAIAAFASSELCERASNALSVLNGPDGKHADIDQHWIASIPSNNIGVEHSTAFDRFLSFGLICGSREPLTKIAKLLREAGVTHLSLEFIQDGGKSSSRQGYVGAKRTPYKDVLAEISKENATIALVLAIIKGNSKAAREALALGADPNVAVGGTPLLCNSDLYAWSGPIIKSLVDAGARLDVKVKKGNKYGGFTPLHFACLRYRGDLVKFLLTKGASVDARDERGETPLLVSACRDTTSIRYLLAAGADVNAANNDGENIVSLIIMGADEKAIEQLKMVFKNRFVINDEAAIRIRAAREFKQNAFVEYEAEVKGVNRLRRSEDDVRAYQLHLESIWSYLATVGLAD